MEYYRLIYVLLALASSSIILTVVAVDSCDVSYGRRGCQHRMLLGVLVTCHGTGTEDKVPQRIPQDTVYLSLSDFNLDKLTKSDFERLKKVECLSIVSSGVNSIDPDAFSGMDSLLELSLQNTNIKSESLMFVTDEKFKAILLTVSGSPHVHKINFPATENLLNLKTLNLNGNGIKEFHRDLFPQLRNLERLDLSHNRLKHLDWKWFMDLSKLNQLYLDHNRLQNIPQTMYGVFFAVKKLTLAGNHLHCNCKLRWLKEFYSFVVDKHLDVADVECTSPQGTRLQEVELGSFGCSKPTTPQIHYVQLDHRYEINCTSSGDPAPQLTLTLADGRKVITPPPDDLSRSNPITPQIVSAPGPIHCEATNSEGFSETVEGLPQSLAMSSAPGLSGWTKSILPVVLVLQTIYIASMWIL